MKEESLKQIAKELSNMNSNLERLIRMLSKSNEVLKSDKTPTKTLIND